MSQLEKGTKTMYGFPKVFPHNPKMCLSFIYLLNGTGLSEIQVGILQEINNFTSLFFIWKESISFSKRAHPLFNAKFILFVKLTFWF